MGRRIQAVRKQRKLTQKSVGEAAGISTGLVGHIERGIKKPSLDTLVGICRKLDVDIHEIVFGTAYSGEALPRSVIDRATELIRELNEFVGR